MTCLEAWIRSLLCPPIRSLEQRFEIPIGFWQW